MAKQLGAFRIIGTKEPVESFYGAFDVIYETSGAPVALDQVIRLAAPLAKDCYSQPSGKRPSGAHRFNRAQRTANHGVIDLHKRISGINGYSEKR